MILESRLKGKREPRSKCEEGDDGECVITMDRMDLARPVSYIF